MTILRKAKDVKRISQVVHVLFKHGLGYFVGELELKFHLPFFKKILKQKFKPPVNAEERLRLVLEELGGTYVKLGQLLSVRPDLIPTECCTELQKLQDEVAPFPFHQVTAVIEREFKKPLKRVFKSFGETPIAAASIGQVHEARLKDGTRVAVKVQRPHIRQKIESDLDIASYFAQRMEKHSEFRKYKPVKIVEELKRYTQNELNYVTEARNADHFYKNFKDSKTVKIPKVFWKYTAPRVLTLEYVDGAKLNDLIKQKQRFNEKKVIKDGLSAVIKQIFEDGLFHADLHPGNILLTKDQKIAFLDFGIVGRLSPRLQRQSLALFQGVMEHNTAAVVDTLLSVGTPTKQLLREDFYREVDDIISGWSGTAPSNERVTHMLHRLFNTAANHDIAMPVDIVLLGKALVTIEATSQLIEPHFDFIKNARPYLKRVVEKQSKIQLKQLSQYYSRFKQALFQFPDSATRILERIKEPTVKVDIADSDIKALGVEIDKSSNRLSYGIVISALIVSGALMLQINPGPKILGISFISMIFFLIATVLGGFLVYSIMSEGRE